MFERVNIDEQLKKNRKKTRREDELLLSQAQQILKKDLFSEEKVLQNLKQYESTFHVIDEEDVDSDLIFTPQEIKNIAVTYRLKFLETGLYKPEIPYAAVLKIKDLDRNFRKELKIFRILSVPDAFSGKDNLYQRSLFVRTNYDNYFLIHRWGEPIVWSRKWKFLPFRNFETMASTIFLFTLVLTLSLPTELITLDNKAEYWSGYRAAAFFHLLIFDFGVTVYFTFAFALNFSSSVWNKLKDFD